MKLTKLILLLFTAFLVISCHRADTYDVTGKAIRLADYQNKWIIVNYWAAWCKPCLMEMPALNAFYRQHKNNVVVFGVNYDHLSDDEVRDFAKKLNITFPLLRSFPIEKFGITDINAIPMTVVISPQQKLQEILHGPQSESALENLLLQEKMPHHK